MARAIPNYELYGELLAGNYTDPIHLEAIRERSRKHHWTIRLHRHSRLAQVFVFQTPGVTMRIAETRHTSTEPMVCYLPPGVPHGFSFAEDVVGEVLSLRLDALGDEVIERLREPGMQSGAFLPESRSAHFGEVSALFEQLGAAYHGLEADRPHFLRALTHLIVTYISADMRQATSVGNLSHSPHLTRHEAQAQRFCALIEQGFMSEWTVGDYARKLDVSAPHLTRVCRRVLGASPNDLVRKRRILEAKRLLEYTQLPVSEIAYRSGFRDPAFFSRSFRNSVGVAPKTYRESRES